MDNGQPRSRWVRSQFRWDGMLPFLSSRSQSQFSCIRFTILIDPQWPYTYDSCDVGTLKNQTLNGQPEIALTSGNQDVNYTLSYLPGQRLSRCTCPGESHPGPKHSDGTYVGRSAPEIDIIEAQIDDHLGGGAVSQSGQWAVSYPSAVRDHVNLTMSFFLTPSAFQRTLYSV